MNPPRHPHDAKCDNGKGGSLLLFRDFVFCTGNSLHGQPLPWVARKEKQLMGS